MDQGPASNYPIAVDSSGNIWRHEVGNDAGSNALPYHLETGELEVAGEGKTFYRVRKLIPDNARISGNHVVTFSTRDYPSGSAGSQGPFTLTSATTKMSVSGRGRSMRYKIAGTELGTDIRLGDWRAEITQTGEAA